jgi:hypothetical protein
MPPIEKIQWWKDHFQNSALLDLEIDLSSCIESADKTDHSVWRLSPFPHGMSRAGVLLHPHPESVRRQWWGSHQQLPPRTLSISVVPYITNNVGEKLVLLPEIKEKLLPLKERREHQLCRRDGQELRCDQPFNRFLPVCASVFDQFANAYPHFYPVVLLHVDQEEHFQTLERFLKKSLNEQQLLELTNRATPIGDTEDMSRLLTRIFDREQAKFLESLPFPVKVTLPNETLSPEQLSYFVFDPNQESPTVLMNERKRSYFTLTYPKNSTINPVAGCSKRAGQDNTLVCETKEYHIADICQTEAIPAHYPHKLVVVSLSDGLSKQSQTIRDSLIEVLLYLQSTSKPFTVLASSGELYTLLTSKQLLTLPEGERHHFLNRQLESGLQFSAGNFSALDLDLVDNLVQVQKQTPTAIGSILYVTDNRGLNSLPQEVSKNKWGVPFSWRKEGIALKVLTSKNHGCEVWHYVDATCLSWQGEEAHLKSVLKSELNKFLNN